MRVDDVFNFRLKKRAKTELDKVKEQMRILKQDKSQIDMQMKLQNLYFFCFWKDQQREPLLKNHLQMNPLTDITQLYFNLEGVGHFLGGVPPAQQADLAGGIVDQESNLSDEHSQGLFQTSMQINKFGASGGLSSAISQQQQ